MRAFWWVGGGSQIILERFLKIYTGIIMCLCVSVYGGLVVSLCVAVYYIHNHIFTQYYVHYSSNDVVLN